MALSLAEINRLDEDAANGASVLRLPGNLLLLAERELLDLWIDVRELRPRRATAQSVDPCGGEHRRRRRPVGIIDQENAGVPQLIDLKGRFLVRELANRVLLH